MPVDCWLRVRMVMCSCLPLPSTLLPPCSGPCLPAAVLSPSSPAGRPLSSCVAHGESSATWGVRASFLPQTLNDLCAVVWHPALLVPCRRLLAVPQGGGSAHSSCVRLGIIPDIPPVDSIVNALEVTGVALAAVAVPLHNHSSTGGGAGSLAGATNLRAQHFSYSRHDGPPFQLLYVSEDRTLAAPGPGACCRREVRAVGSHSAETCDAMRAVRVQGTRQPRPSPSSPWLY